MERSNVERCSEKSEVFAAVGASERVRPPLSRHNSETTSKPYPIPNTYEEEDEKRRRRRG